MTDAQTLRTEIKSWERAFKAKHDRTPTVQDIKDNPEIGASRRHLVPTMFAEPSIVSCKIQTVQEIEQKRPST